MLRSAVLLVWVVACGAKKPPVQPEPVAKPPPPPETEADREAKRHAAAIAIVPEGSSCLPAGLKEENGPMLDMAAVKNDTASDAIICAIDSDRTRLLGPVGCWKIDLQTGALAYHAPVPLPGRNLDALLDGRCVRGLCLPDDTKLPETKTVHLSWSSPDAAKVAMLVGDDVHLFDAASKSHSSVFSIRGDKGVTGTALAIYATSDDVFVEGNDGTTTNVWRFKSDGTASGPLTGISDNKPLSTYHGAFMVLDIDHVGIAERGFTTLTSFKLDTGQRIKAVRKIGKLACKPEEVEAYWHDGDSVSDKCKGSIASQYATFIGATALMGRTSLLVMLRDDRLGELSVMDPKSLAEKKALKMPWCGAAGTTAETSQAQ